MTKTYQMDFWLQTIANEPINPKYSVSNMSIASGLEISTKCGGACIRSESHQMAIALIAKRFWDHGKGFLTWLQTVSWSATCFGSYWIKHLVYFGKTIFPLDFPLIWLKTWRLTSVRQWAGGFIGLLCNLIPVKPTHTICIKYHTYYQM